MHDQAENRLRLYRSHLSSPEQLRYVTVARESLVQDTLELLRGSATKRSKHHFLFIGPRGIGKSHLLSLVENGVTRDAELAQGYRVVRFPEEAHRILSFADFLLGLCEILAETLPHEPHWQDLHEKLCTEEDDATIVETLVPAIRRENRKKERTLLIMLENVNEVFGHQMRKKIDVGALRKFFMEDNQCLLMATSPVHFQAITSVDEPLYDFFDTQILDHLAEEDSIELVRRSLEWDKREDLLETFDELRPKLRTLYRMTAGNPRLTVMLYELIAHDSITRVRRQMEMLLDRITPFYQDRLNDLPPQERAVLETMACMRDQEKTPASIALRMRMSQQQTSSLLKRLTDARYIRAVEHPKDRRSRLYNIREGFFDIWLAMNLSRSARKRIPCLLDFYEMFYPSIEERDRKREALRRKLAEEGGLNVEGTLDHLSEVGGPDERARSKLRMANHFAGRGEQDKVATYLGEACTLSIDPVGRWIVDRGAESTDYLSELEEMVHCWEAHRSGDMERFAGQLAEIGSELTFKNYSEAKLEFLEEQLELLDDPDDRVSLRIRISKVLFELARWEDAEHLLRAALEEVSEHSTHYSVLLNNLAQVLWVTNRLAEAEAPMRRALEIDKESLGEDHPAVAKDLNNLAVLLQDTNRLAEAEPLMGRALEIGEASLGGDHPKVAISLNNLALLLQDTDRLTEAEPLMRRALEIDEASLGGDHPKVARDLNNLARLLQRTDRVSEAEPMLRRALEILVGSLGGEHPRSQLVLKNYRGLLTVTGLGEDAIEDKVKDALKACTTE